MNIAHNDNLRERLAAEYVLGTLRHGARRRFESWLPGDAALRRSVAEWQDRLNPMAEFAQEAQPSQQVWVRIEKTLGLNAVGKAQGPFAFWINLHNDLAFWRGLGLVSTTLATILVAVMATRNVEPTLPPVATAPVTSYVATLSDDKETVMVVTGDAQRHEMTVKVVIAQNIAADTSLELWALPASGTPRSLGLVAANGAVTLKLPADVTPATMPLLAISLEPKGGSPNPNGPTGPVKWKGAWVQI